MNQHLESGGSRGPKNLESGNCSPKNLESGNWENIWNLGSGGFWIFFGQNNLFSSYMGHKYPNINLFYKWTHKQRQGGPGPLPFQGRHQISEGIFKWPQMKSHGTMWLCDALNYYFHFWLVTNTFRFNNLVQYVLNKSGMLWNRTPPNRCLCCCAKVSYL